MERKCKLKSSVSKLLLVGAIVAISIKTSQQVESESKLNKEQCDAVGEYLRNNCQDFSRVKNLDKFHEFYTNFSTLDACLRSKGLEFKNAAQRAEEICEHNGILFANVRTLGQLVTRFLRLEPVCTLEIAAKIYRLHKQLEQIGGENWQLMKIVKIFANRLQTRCRQSLDRRLRNVEKRAPDILKFITVINGILNVGSEKIDQLAIDVEQYVPVLQSELIPAAESSIGHSAGGHEFKMTQQIKMALEVLKMSCQSMQNYHINLLGSIGLLASIGHAARPELVSELSKTEADGPIKPWLLSAVLCQAFRNTLRMAELTLDGKNLGRVKVLQMQEADVSEDLEINQEFASYKLPELKTPIEDLDKELAGDDYVYPKRGKINLRKIQLIEGPNFRLANAMYTYLDMNQKENRLKIPYDILGTEMPVVEKSPSADGSEFDDEDD